MTMRLTSRRCSFLAIIAFLFPLSATTASARLGSQTSPASRVSQREAGTLFSAIQTDARQASEQADTLSSQGLQASDAPSWGMVAGELNQLRAEVNQVAGMVGHLEAIRSTVPPEQRKAIDRMAAALQLLAGDTQDAIVLANSNHEDLWNPTYRQYLNEAADEAEALTHSSSGALRYGKVLKPYRGLEGYLDRKGSS